MMAQSWFAISDINQKLAELPEALARGLRLSERVSPFTVGRDVRVVLPSELPNKPGLSQAAGQARLLHDLASIELQAMELAVRSLYEYPDAPHEFREQLADLAAGEGRHLKLCLDGMERLGFHWGSWDVHLSLWNAVSAEDSLLDRLLIVHRHLEGSGLDAGESILRRLRGAGQRGGAREVVEVIVSEEVDHVLFGSRWYRKVCEDAGLDPDHDFAQRMPRILRAVPRKERLALELRRRAGFSELELIELQRFQSELTQR